MPKWLIICALLTQIILARAQNLINNSNFEAGGQPYCGGWFDDCGNELTFLCHGIVDSGCNHPNYGASLFQDAPPGGGGWCMKMTAYGSQPVASMQTVLVGKFLGVYEFKVWLKADNYGARGGVFFYYKAGEFYTGMGNGVSNNAINPFTWNLFTIRDTIRKLSDTVIVMVNHNISYWGAPGRYTFVDLPDFRMIESWTDVPDMETGEDVHVIAAEQMIIQVANGNKGNYHISLYNIFGQQVKDSELMPGGVLVLDSQFLAKGMYFYKVTQQQRVVKTGKFFMP